MDFLLETRDIARQTSRIPFNISERNGIFNYSLTDRDKPGVGFIDSTRNNDRPPVDFSKIINYGIIISLEKVREDPWRGGGARVGFLRRGR